MIYVTSDLHGYALDKFKALLAKANFSDEDYCFVLGDVIDRGAEGVRLLRWMMLQPNVALIRGNHEQMMLDSAFAFEEITDESIERVDRNRIATLFTWQHNGGEVTMRALRALDAETRGEIFDFVRDAPYCDTVSAGGRDFLLTHSGLSAFRADKPLREYYAEDFLWNRPSPSDRYYDDVITVFGHTPTICFPDARKGRAYVTDTWIDVDTGAAFGLAPMLLRLDDLAEFYADDGDPSEGVL